MSPTFIKLPTNESGTSTVLVNLNNIKEFSPMGANHTCINYLADSFDNFIKVNIPYQELVEILSSHCKVIHT